MARGGKKMFYSFIHMPTVVEKAEPSDTDHRQLEVGSSQTPGLSRQT